jgi:hypothetical protein
MMVELLFMVGVDISVVTCRVYVAFYPVHQPMTKRRWSIMAMEKKKSLHV